MPEADDGEPVLSELAQRQPPAALDDGDLAALGDAAGVQRREPDVNVP